MSDLRAWWNATGRGQPPRLGIDIGDLIAVYLSEADAEGVRGDLAFAQAVAETGHFTNSDTAINNFAGIAHHDGASSGEDFPDPVVGVRAHIQLLKKYAAGNDTALAHTDVSPDAGATATTLRWCAAGMSAEEAVPAGQRLPAPASPPRCPRCPHPRNCHTTRIRSDQPGGCVAITGPPPKFHAKRDILCRRF